MEAWGDGSNDGPEHKFLGEKMEHWTRGQIVKICKRQLSMSGPII